jgi:hypothetical protein
MTKSLRVFNWTATVLAAGVSLGASDARAFLHDSSAHDRHHHGKGCFVTTSAVNHTRGIRHWRSPCPHQERRHLNPYHHGYHRLPPGH